MISSDGPSTRRGLLASSEAVSPVIGVILMVAITVVLAATVFVLVSDIGPGGGSSLPNIALEVSEAQDRATVTTASQDASWDQLEIRLSEAGQWGWNAAPDQALAADTWQIIEGGRVAGGDYLEICLTAEGPVDVDIRYIDLNTVISGFSLTNAAECP